MRKQAYENAPSMFRTSEIGLSSCKRVFVATATAYRQQGSHMADETGWTGNRWQLDTYAIATQVMGCFITAFMSIAEE